MKRLLLLMPNYYGFDEVIIDTLKKHSGCEVININYDVGFKYSSLFQRVKNAFSKLILRKNLKPQFKESYFLSMIQSYSHFDYIIANRPDILPNSVLDAAIERSKENILLLWDSLNKVSISQGIINKFNHVFSFDNVDCRKYQFQKVENFHYNTTILTNQFIEESNFDAVFLGTVDNRVDDLHVIMDYLRAREMEVHAFLHIPRERKLTRRDNVTILKKIVPFKFSYSFVHRSKIIIDLAHENQSGLSFRIFEAMKLEKKLITTNKSIRSYDFYRAENIFVIDDINDIKIPDHFFNTKYVSLPEDILQKYSAKSWVNQILNNEN